MIHHIQRLNIQCKCSLYRHNQKFYSKWNCQSLDEGYLPSFKSICIEMLIVLPKFLWLTWKVGIFWRFLLYKEKSCTNPLNLECLAVPSEGPTFISLPTQSFIVSAPSSNVYLCKITHLSNPNEAVAVRTDWWTFNYALLFTRFIIKHINEVWLETFI